jgi:ribosomal protein L31E
MIIKAILKINPNAEVSVIDNDINQITWHNGTTPIPKSDIEAKMAELPTPEEEATARENLKASAKAKLIAGEPLTEEEANTIVL